MFVVKVVRVEVEWSNGSIERSEGEEAQQVWSAVESAFVMMGVHGMPYKGPRMKVVRAGRTGDEQAAGESGKEDDKAGGGRQPQ